MQIQIPCQKRTTPISKWPFHINLGSSKSGLPSSLLFPKEIVFQECVAQGAHRLTQRWEWLLFWFLSNCPIWWTWQQLTIIWLSVHTELLFHSCSNSSITSARPCAKVLFPSYCCIAKKSHNRKLSSAPSIGLSTQLSNVYSINFRMEKKELWWNSDTFQNFFELMILRSQAIDDSGQQLCIFSITLTRYLGIALPDPCSSGSIIP